MLIFDPTLHDPATCERNPCRRCRPHVSAAPAVKTNPHDAQHAPGAPDTIIASIGLPRHATPRNLAAAAHNVADRLHQHGDAAITMAAVLAARGYAASTLGDGGSRATDNTSSTERAGTRDRRDPWIGVDHRLAAALSDLDRAATRADALLAEILFHAEDLDPVPAGTGECAACPRFCRPTKARPGFRLRSGLCPSCYGAWREADGSEGRTDWVRARRSRLTDASGQVHPEDDSHIDMTRETAVTPHA